MRYYIEESTVDAKAAMMRVCIRYVLGLPHMNVDTKWGESITGLTMDLAREVDTILDRIRDTAFEQYDHARRLDDLFVSPPKVAE